MASHDSRDRDALSAAAIRTCVMVVFSAQIFCGQTLPMFGERPLNTVIASISKFAEIGALRWITLVLSILIFVAAVSRKGQAWAAFAYMIYMAILSWFIMPSDPYVGSLFIIYSIFGMLIAASAATFLKDAEQPNAD